MTRVRSRRGRRGLALLGCAALGFVAGWIVRGHPPEPAHAAAAPVGIAGDASGATPALEALQQKNLRVPIDGADVASWKGQFAEARASGAHPHEAVDILAPRGTAIHAVDEGTIAKLFFSKGGGGNTIYQFDPSGRFCYYYAHLERYADGVHEGDRVSRGDVIGYVGTSGDAPPDTPHLHFAIFELNAERQWWKGTPIDPYLAYRR